MIYSIIIPFHSNKTLLLTCLDSLFDTISNDAEIIVVANNYDKTQIQLDIQHPNVQVIIVEKNIYYSAAINLGASKARGDYLLFCDTDTVYTYGWLKALHEGFMSHKDIGFASPMLLSPVDGRIIDFGIAFSRFNGPHPYKNQKKGALIANRSFFPQAACSASGMIQKKTFEQLGGFRDELGYSYADIDLCIQLKEIGLRTFCVNNSHVYHKGNSVLTPMNSFIKADVKALFYAINKDKIDIDLIGYYHASSDIAKKRGILDASFFLIDFSSVYDKQWYYDVFSKELGIHICDYYVLAGSERDSAYISLYERVPHHFQQLRIPIIYFVDEMSSLRANHLWRKLRENDRDLIIDRNANIELLGEVIEGVC